MGGAVAMVVRGTGALLRRALIEGLGWLVSGKMPLWGRGFRGMNVGLRPVSGFRL